MKQKRVLLSVLFLMVALPLLHGQSYLRPPFLNEQKNRSYDFYDVQEAFRQWDHAPENREAHGKKRFMRWEWYYENRVYPSGAMPSENVNFVEWQRLNNHYQGYSNKATKEMAHWVSISPNQVPTPNNETNITGSGRINCIEFHPTDPNTFWVGASQGGVWKTTDNGQSWICLTDNLPLNRISDIAVDPTNPLVLYVATGDIEYFGLNVTAFGHHTHYGLGVFKTTDGGGTWDPLGLDIELADGDMGLLRKIFVHPTNTSELVVAGIPGIYKSMDGGITWVQKYDNFVIDFDMNPENPNTLFATGLYIPNEGGATRILRSQDFGDTWDTLNTTILPVQNEILRAELTIAPSDSNIIYTLACGPNEGFYALFKSEDAGENWFAVAARDTNEFSAAAKAPNMLGWYDGGYWGLGMLPPDESGQGTYDLTLVVHPTNPDTIYTGGINMWGSYDGGSTWDIASYWVANMGPSLHADQHASKVNPISHTIYQCNDGGIYKSNSVILGSMDSVATCFDPITYELTPGCYTLPTNWINISHGLHISEYYRIGLCKNDPNIIVGGTQDNGSFMYRNGIWKHVYGGDGMEAMVHHTNSDIVYVTTQRGGLKRSTDGGLSFERGLEEPITNTGETGFWVTPYEMHPDTADIIYTAFQNVWRSEDGGDTWTKISDFGTPGWSSSVHVLKIAPSDPNYIYASVTGAVFLTKDGGANWSAISMQLPTGQVVPTSICIADNDPENVWISFNGYHDGEKVYHSTDAGQNWENISGILPNVAANTLAYQVGTIDGVEHAVYVGTDIGVFYTNDSIQQTPDKWILFSEGLPNVLVAELEIQYGSQKLYAATYGRGIWESSLYSPSVIEGIEPVSETDFVLTVYPNPTSDEFSITLGGIGYHEVEIGLLTLHGQKVLYEKFIDNGAFTKTVNIEDLPPSVYLLQIHIGNSDYTHRIIKTSD